MSSKRKSAVADISPVSGHGPTVTVLERAAVLGREPDPVFDRWTSALRRHTGAVVGCLCLFDRTRRLVKSASTVGGSAGQVAEVTQSVPLKAFIWDMVHSNGMEESDCSYAEAPLTVDGQIVGCVCIAGDRIHAWTEEQLETLADTAAAVATEVTLRLAKETAERLQELVAADNRVHDLIAQGVPLRAVLVEMLESIERHDPSLRPSVLLLDPVANTLHSGVGPSLPPEYLLAIDGVVIGPNVGTCGSAAWSGQLTVTVSIADDPKWVPIRHLAAGAGLAHCWSMPIKALGGEVLGTLAFYGREPRKPFAEHLTLLEDWARVAGIAIERHRALDRLTHDARHDGLTGLPNRMAIFEALEAAIQRVSPEALAAVLFVDLDGLKELNDTLGHERADEMIREIAERLSSAVRANDFVGRFGGDEFVVITEGIRDPEEAAVLAARLLSDISAELPGIQSTVVTASIGIALVRSTAVDAAQALRESDHAMYEAKRAGRDRCVFFEVDRPARTGRRLLISRELRGAEVRGETRLVFQPVFASSAIEIVGVEALLRWNSPTFGAVAPTEFIPIAEHTGTIVPIGAWVLRESCETVSRLPQVGTPLELAVNVSARQVSNPDFALWVRQILAHAEFPANRLGLEITETALMRPNAVTTRNLRELDALGVRIVLDDFGTGFSSLAWLKEHPLSAIKIDRSFIGGLPANAADQAIVAAVIGMARALGCVVTAEGVETREQLEALQSLDCERLQGFLLARPLPAEELAALLASRSVIAPRGILSSASI